LLSQSVCGGVADTSVGEREVLQETVLQLGNELHSLLEPTHVAEVLSILAVLMVTTA
jgi:hypothetical protein